MKRVDWWGVAGMAVCLVSGWLMLWIITIILECATGAC